MIPTLITPQHSRMRGIWFLLFYVLESEQAKVTLIFILLHVFWGWRHERAAYFLGVKRFGGKRVSCTIVDHSSLLTYFLLLPLFALWLRRYPGTWLYFFWEEGFLV